MISTSLHFSCVPTISSDVKGRFGHLIKRGGYFFASGVAMGTYYTRVAIITRNTVLLNRQGTHMRAVNYKWVQM